MAPKNTAAAAALADAFAALTVEGLSVTVRSLRERHTFRWVDGGHLRHQISTAPVDDKRPSRTASDKPIVPL